MDRCLLRRFALAASLAALITIPGSASAATTVGQTFFPTSACSGGPDWEVLQTGRASGPSYAVPLNGVLTSWSFEAGAAQTVMTLRVFRPTGIPHQYQVIADGSELKTIPAASGVNTKTFPTRISVQAGDLIGIHSTSGVCGTPTNDPGDTFDYRFGTATAVGATNTYTELDGFIYDISAQLEPTNTFTISSITRNKKKGTATMTFNVPNPGELTGSGNGVKVASAAVTSKTVSAPGNVQLLIKAKGKKKKKLNQKGKVKLSVAVAYTPTGGDPSTQSVKVKLKKKL